MKKILEYICVVVSYFYTVNLEKKRGKFLNLLYTYWIKRHFKYIDNTVKIERSSRITGAEFISIGMNSIIGQRAILAAHSSFENQKFTPDITIGTGG